MAEHGPDEPDEQSALVALPRDDPAAIHGPRHARHATSRRRRRSDAYDPSPPVAHVSARPPTGAQWRRLRRLIGVGLVLIVTAVTLGSTLHQTAPPVVNAAAQGPVTPAQLVPSPPPKPLRLATRSSVVLYVPIDESRITAILYHGVTDSNALDLTPSGRLLNAGVLDTIKQQVFGTDQAAPGYYLDGAPSSVDVGTRAGTEVYSPVDGTVTSISPYILNGQAWGSVLAIEPVADPSVVVRIENINPEPTLKVGDTVSATQTPTLLGTVADLSLVERMDLAHFTSDAGNHVHIELRPAVALSIP